MNWLIFAGVCALIVLGCWSAWDSMRSGGYDVGVGEWSYGTTLLSHVAPDGEVLEFVTSWEWPWEEVAEALAWIERLPEVAA